MRENATFAIKFISFHILNIIHSFKECISFHIQKNLIQTTLFLFIKPMQDTLEF